jgi:hypothetical protein
MAWTSFEDAGGNPHLCWHTFHPGGAVLTDTFDRIVELARLDARERSLRIGPFERTDVI